MWVTALGKLAAEHGINVLNLAARRASYERRLARYYGRGYDIVLPHLNAASEAAMQGRLPYLPTGGVIKRENNSLFVFWIGIGACGPQEASDYAPYEIAYHNPHGMNVRNVMALSSSPVRELMLCAGMKWGSASDIFSIQPVASYPLLFEIVEGLFRADKVDASRLRRWLGPECAAMLVSEYMKNGSVSEELVATICAGRCARLPSHALPFSFMRVEENTALTGPFNRQVVSLEQWYGEAYAGRSLL